MLKKQKIIANVVVGLLDNESSDSNRLTLVTPKSENDVRLQAKLGNQNPMGLPVGVVSVVVPKVQETVKQVVAKYNAESLISNRAEVSTTIEDNLRDILAGYNIELVAASMENMDFTDAFTNAVEAKQVAEQNKIKAQTEQEQAIIEAKAAAEKVRIDAQAQADAQLIAAQNDVEVQKLAADAAEYAGQKQAAVNERISQSLTPELNQYYLIEAWKDGAAMPNTVVGDSSLINGVLNYGK